MKVRYSCRDDDEGHRITSLFTGRVNDSVAAFTSLRVTERHHPASLPLSPSHSIGSLIVHLSPSHVHSHPAMPSPDRENDPSLHNRPSFPPPPLNKSFSPIPPSLPTPLTATSLDARTLHLLTQLNYDYSSKGKPARRVPVATSTPSALPLSPHTSSTPGPTTVEHRYMQWKRFWQSVESDPFHLPSLTPQQAPSTLPEDAAKIEQLLAFTQARRMKALEKKTAESEGAIGATPPSTPRSPTYYANLARFLSTAPSSRVSTHQPTRPSRRSPRTRSSTSPIPTPASSAEFSSLPTPPAPLESLHTEAERVEVVIDSTDDSHVAPLPFHHGASSPSSPPLSSPPLSIPLNPTNPTSSSYSYTNLPPESVHRPSAEAPTSPPSFSSIPFSPVSPCLSSCVTSLHSTPHS